MKKLVVSIKTTKQVLKDFSRSLKRARQGKFDEHFEVSFDNAKDFTRFVKNIDILMAVINHKPKSIYELSKIVRKDLSNLNKLILFFQNSGLITIKKTKSGGRILHTPVVEYRHIEFDLGAA